MQHFLAERHKQQCCSQGQGGWFLLRAAAVAAVGQLAEEPAEEAAEAFGTVKLQHKS